MKFIHTSDWHIGRQFHNVSLLEDQAFIMKQVIHYITEQRVDALVISGDIYDRTVPPASAIKLLNDTFSRICQDLKVPVVLIPGNHDSDVRLGFGSGLMKNSGLYIMSQLEHITEPVSFSENGVNIDFYGIPYCEPLQVKNAFNADVSTYDDAHSYLVNTIKQHMQKDHVNVLISHCFIDGAAESESERPLQIGGADRVSYQPCVDFDYVALGHLHSPQYKGAEHIRYSGSIMKYSFSEQYQKKGVTLVEINDEGAISHQHLPLNPIRDMRVIEGQFADILDQGKVDPKNQDYLLIRLLDKHAILDPMGKLREVYPNVLHLERPNLTNNINHTMDRDALKRSEYDMFKDFYSQVQGEEMSKEQQLVVSQLIDELSK